MTVADFSLIFDTVLAVLLAVMIFYAVRLNQRIALLRSQEADMQQMIAQFNESSVIAQESAQRLRSAGTEAEFGVKAAIAKGMALQNDLELLLDQAELLVDRMDDARTPTPPVSDPAPAPMPRPAETFPTAAAAEEEAVSNIRRFSPPVRSADEVIRSETPAPAEDAPLQPRTEAEKQLLDAIRAAKEGAI